MLSFSGRAGVHVSLDSLGNFYLVLFDADLKSLLVLVETLVLVEKSLLEGALKLLLLQLEGPLKFSIVSLLLSNLILQLTQLLGLLGVLGAFVVFSAVLELLFLNLVVDQVLLKSRCLSVLLTELGLHV